jgi:hypothetical protein
LGPDGGLAAGAPLQTSRSGGRSGSAEPAKNTLIHQTLG